MSTFKCQCGSADTGIGCHCADRPSLKAAARPSDETGESPEAADDLLRDARAELPDPDFIPDVEKEHRVRQLMARIDAHLSVSAYTAHRAAQKASEVQS